MREVLLLVVQVSRAADERVIANVKTQGSPGLARKANPSADSYFRGFMVVMREPQWPFPAEIDSVQVTIDGERNRKTAGPSRQVAQVLNTAIALH